MATHGLLEVDSIEITVIVDNELDPISPSPNPDVKHVSRLPLTPIVAGQERGDAEMEWRMDSICCAAHGLSLMITATRGEVRHTLLFDAGPEEDVWERNVGRLRVDVGAVERIHLSHWHRDHSGGMLRAIHLVNAAKKPEEMPVVADLHPQRPDFRGMEIPNYPTISLEADPSFDQITEAGATLLTSNLAHTVLDGFFLVSGEIPRLTAYEGGLPGALRFSSTTGQWESDELIRDERLVACNLKGKGLVVFTGCSHAGVINASRHALELGGGRPLYAVVGGFHLADGTPEKLQSTLDDLKLLDPKVVMPGHCTGWRFKFKVEENMPGCLVPSFVGTKYLLSSGAA